ncbi:uncharacterized protein BP01DRAFT_385631 [Aspergillus saccharolyticus JOP 1030-1]|uniref:Uncharacterized protein n=1 Tax=Aspergillus saccharolyticus JOP 1030-1 TaxID=1450539 RepID=A0A318Z5C9_9EURO|nr:hypothetical protein BP01DRAFT_385631 [Aspergillus saccharolyticus JOP 1030-1]PYH42316.1 hypothetical protein BP01DRAFT_385631 [Aspergillus saccharolyticus JOP 1030-1]
MKDWESGASMGGCNFVDGMTDGFTGSFTQPIKGAKEEKVLSAVRGFAKGTIGLATKLPFWLVAYPFQGIARTVEGLARSKTRKAIINARLRDGLYIAGQIHLTPEEEAEVLRKFQALARPRDGLRHMLRASTSLMSPCLYVLELAILENIADDLHHTLRSALPQNYRKPLQVMDSNAPVIHHAAAIVTEFGL